AHPPLPLFSPEGTAEHTHLPAFPTRRSSDLGSSGSVPRGVPSAPTVSFSTRASACFNRRSQCSRSASPRSYMVMLSSSSTSPRSDRKSTRLNSSHVKISYAVFCLKKKNDEPV